MRLIGRGEAWLHIEGKLVIRAPNMTAPWGLQYQYTDPTHKGFYAPGNIRQLGLAAGLTTESCLP